MIRFYCAALLCAAIFLSYFVGGHIANIKCRERVANANVAQIISDTKTIGDINDTVFRTGVGDIRRILHQKYTIGE